MGVCWACSVGRINSLLVYSVTNTVEQCLKTNFIKSLDPAVPKGQTLKPRDDKTRYN